MTYKAYLRTRKEAFKKGLTWERVLRIATAGACVLMFAIVVGQIYMFEGRRQGREEFKKQVQDIERRLTNIELDLQNEEEARLDLLAYRIMTCESGRKHNGVWGDHGKSYGILQYKKETFFAHARQAGLSNADWQNQWHQIYLFKWAVTHGKGNDWTCYRRLYGNMEVY